MKWNIRMAIAGVVGLAGTGLAGDLYPSVGPDEAGSAMFTTKDVRDRLTTGTNAPLRAGAFAEPAAGPTAGTMPTLNEIMEAAPATNAAGAVAGDVRVGKVYWGLSQGAWGMRTGTIETVTLSAASATVSEGYYAATTLTNVDPDLAATNIRVSTVVFGQTGTLRPALGNADPAQVLTGRTFTTNDSAQLTGTMTNYAARGFMPGAVNASIPAGYYSGSGVVTGDADLVTANIRAGVNLFGVTGTPAVVNTASGTAVAGDILAGDTAYVNGVALTGTMTNYAARGFMPGAVNASIPAGYYSGSGVVTGDADLVTANIRAGVNLFGVTGTPAVVNTASGTAVAGDILAGKIAFVNGASLTGTMASNVLSAASATVSAGYYAATTLTNVESDLKATNVVQGVTIFGVTGTVYRAGLPKTGQTTSYQTGDDGTYDKGLAWPSPRFTVQANTNCVLDNLTGLIWARNASLTNGVNWSNAVVFCEALNYGGQTDWRLPNRVELESLLNLGALSPALPAGHPFTGVLTGYYWSSSTYHTLANGGWCVTFTDAQVNSTGKSVLNSVWPVRGGQ